jgi:hypothetical protein
VSDIHEMLGKFVWTARGRVAQIVSIQAETQSLALMFKTGKARAEIWIIKAGELHGYLIYESEAACREAQKVSPVIPVADD